MATLLGRCNPLLLGEGDGYWEGNGPLWGGDKCGQCGRELAQWPWVSCERKAQKKGQGQILWQNPALPKGGQELLCHGPLYFWSSTAHLQDPNARLGLTTDSHMQPRGKGDKEGLFWQSPSPALVIYLHCDLHCDWVAYPFQTSVYLSVTWGSGHLPQGAAPT